MSEKEQLKTELKQIREAFLDKRMEQLELKDKDPAKWKELEAECTALANEHQEKFKQYDLLPSNSSDRQPKGEWYHGTV